MYRELAPVFWIQLQNMIKLGDSMTKRVLVVDDDDLNREVIAAMLEDQDCVFDEAENGLDAVARASNAHYDVIYMDIMMPVMDGVSATQQIRKKLGASRTLIIAVTAKDLVGNAKSWAAAGFDD